MIKKDFLTVKEVANILGCSVQAVYNRLEKDFKPYLKIENGKKRVDKAILEIIQPKKNSTDFKEDFKLILNLLEKQNDQLHKELEIKNKQIEELQNQNTELTYSIKLQAESINVDRKNELVENIIDSQQQITKEEIKPKKKWWKFY